MTSPAAPAPVRIGNCSGFLGDRLSAAAELVASDEIDVLTGDWLAELTMLILARQRIKGGAGSGYARTFLTQMEQVLGTCLDRGVRVVTNAGGLDPSGCADALGELATTLGLAPTIGVVTGDDVLPVVGGRPDAFRNLDTGEQLGGRALITANAYLGGEPVSLALAAGADVVIGGRITDAALVVGPAAWWHGWSYADAAAGDPTALDQLAGAVAAGHVIECGAQATGGNYSFFAEVPAWPASFPIAQVAADGSSVITKPTGSGGLVSVGTVTAQLMYEIGAPTYANPDVTALFDSVALAQAGPDQVSITGTRGAAAPARLKVAGNLLAGYRNAMSVVLTGRDARPKADLALRLVAGLGLDDALGDPAAGRPAPGPRELAEVSTLDVDDLHVAFEDVASDDPGTTAAAQGHLRISVKDLDAAKVGKPFTAAVVESTLGSFPGMFLTAPPAPGSAYGVYWPTVIDRADVQVRVSVGDRVIEVPSRQPAVEPSKSGSQSPSGASAPAHGASADGDGAVADGAGSSAAADGTTAAATGATADGDGGVADGDGGPSGVAAATGQPAARWAPEPGAVLGDIVGTRSGDKGGDANVGVWIPEPGVGPSAGLSAGEVAARYRWLAGWLSPDRVRRLLPEAAELDVDVYRLPNLNGVNVVIHGLLGRGVADSTSLDPQAKGLGEHLRARRIR